MRNVTTNYDAAGLPTSASDAVSGETITYAHDEIGDLTGVDSSIAANDWTYQYDAYSRLTCAVQGTSCASGSTRVLFAMDAFDRALTRTKGSSTTSLTYRGIAESIAKTVNGSTTTTYANASGSPLAEKTGSTASFYLRDPHGDVVGLASTAAANQGTSSFDPWGRSLSTTGQTSFLGYQGDMTDPDTKQVDMGTRWYAAELGRFTARDVIFGELTSPMTLNQHVYGGLNPITMWDPTGMKLEHGGGGGPCEGVTCYTDYSEGSSACYSCGSGHSSSGAASAFRHPEPDPPSLSVQEIARDSTIGLATRALDYGTALDREANHIWDKIGRGFVEGRAIQTWDTVALARHGSTAARVSRLGGGILRGAARRAPWASAAWDTVSDLRSGGPPSGVISRNALAFGTALTVEKAGLAGCASVAPTGLLAAGCAGVVTVGAALTYSLVRAGVDPEDMAELVDHVNPYGNSEGWASLIRPRF